MGFVIIEILTDESIDAQHMSERITEGDGAVYDSSDINAKFVDEKEVKAYLKDYMNTKE